MRPVDVIRARLQGYRSVPVSRDPSRGLQPITLESQQWLYQPDRRNLPAPVRAPFVDTFARDLSAERRAATPNDPPRCTGCLVRLDPKWCGNVADDDRDAR
jgi:hypothetical protein